MAFTNPILAGEELNRTGIKSDNFVAGSSGWRIASNGSAEFQDMTVRGNLSMGAATLGGRDLFEFINSQAFGVMAWIRGFATTATLTEAQIFTLEYDVLGGRIYEVALMNVTPDIANVKSAEFHIRYVTGTSGWPTNASPQMANSLRLSQFELGTARALYVPASDTRLRLAATITSLDGANVRCWCPGDGGIFAIYDLGYAPGQSGTVGTSTPGKTLKEFTISANVCQTYYPGGARLTGYYANDMVQGNALSSATHFHSWAFYSAGDLALLADLNGVPASDILTCEIYLDWRFIYDATITGLIGLHNVTSLPGGNEPAGALQGLIQPVYPSNGAWWVSALGNSTFMNAVRTGTIKGLCLGSGADTNTKFGGIADGQNASAAIDPPRIHIKYYK